LLDIEKLREQIKGLTIENNAWKKLVDSHKEEYVPSETQQRKLNLAVKNYNQVKEEIIEAKK
jgi:hypothetical protein